MLVGIISRYPDTSTQVLEYFLKSRNSESGKYRFKKYFKVKYGARLHLARTCTASKVLEYCTRSTCIFLLILLFKIFGQYKKAGLNLVFRIL